MRITVSRQSLAVKCICVAFIAGSLLYQVETLPAYRAAAQDNQTANPQSGPTVQKPLTDDKAAASNSQTEPAADKIRKAEWVAIGVNTFILFVIFWQAWIYNEQRKMMKEQKRMTTIAERAYISIKDVKINSPIVKNTFIVHTLIANGGRTPAIGIDRKFQIGLVEEPRQFDWDATPSANEIGSTILPAGAEKWVTLSHVPFTIAEFKEFDDGKRKIHACGELRFTDYMGIKQIFSFDMTCEAKDNGAFKENYQRQYDNPN